jgi:subtilisin family serine protease
MRRIIVRPRSPDAAPDAEAVVSSVVAGGAERGARVIKPSGVRGQSVIYLTDADVQALAAFRHDLIVEEDQPLELYRMPGLPSIMSEVAEETWEVTVRDGMGAPIPDCTIYAVGRQLGFRGETDEQGRAPLRVQRAVVERLIISPRQGHWSRVVAPPAGGVTTVETTLSPLDAVSASEWVHQLLGVNSTQAGPSGCGATVAVVDSGVAPVAGVVVAGGLNTLDNGDPARWDVDEKGHGTHCAGILAARPTAVSGFRGIAPEVTLYAVKVFPGGFISDLIEAIDWCRDRKIDLVNLSLGGSAWSQALALAIEEATDAGVTLVAATGNESNAVAFPASHPDVFGVSAIGCFGSFPSDSAHSLKVGPYRDWQGGLFGASFTNFGPEVNVCAPGVAIASTVPTGFAAWDGTSMACPIVTGMLALALEVYPGLRTGTRAQSEALRWIAAAAAIDSGMPPQIQGFGLPTVPRLLAAAKYLIGG